MVEMSNTGRSSRVWLLPRFEDNYESERYSDRREYYAGLRREWAYRLEEAEKLVEELHVLGAPIVHRRSITMNRRNMTDYEAVIRRIRKENNRMLLHRCRYYMLKLARDQAEVMGRELAQEEVGCVLRCEKYLSDEYMSDED